MRLNNMRRLFILSIFIFVGFYVQGQTYGHFGKKNIVNLRTSLTAIPKYSLSNTEFGDFHLVARNQFSYERILTNYLSLSINFITSKNRSFRNISEFGYNFINDRNRVEYQMDFDNSMKLRSNFYFSELKYYLIKMAPYSFYFTIGGGVAYTNFTDYSNITYIPITGGINVYNHEEFLEFIGINYNENSVSKPFLSIGSGYRFPLNKNLILGSYAQILVSSFTRVADKSSTSREYYSEILTSFKSAQFRSANFSFGVEINFLF
jgi:hypothetical protein